ncbi:hypothetical protein PoB_000815100 [Plakobranchus ocellatus]|uniref:Uncharacterized protein n=1 Tax=Plakobranchus ocellatus TaxID=259542 RepID=A0AAV3YEN7_9GAST|nr:hypothetical protein PoB_000815100 [Plakobranchus ocellatus]
MDKVQKYLWVFTALIVFLAVQKIPKADGASKANMYDLHDDLFTSRGYKKQVRPIADDSNSLFVYLAFSLLSLVDHAGQARRHLAARCPGGQQRHKADTTGVSVGSTKVL